MCNAMDSVVKADSLRHEVAATLDATCVEPCSIRALFPQLSPFTAMLMAPYLPAIARLIFAYAEMGRVNTIVQALELDGRYEHLDLGDDVPTPKCASVILLQDQTENGDVPTVSRDAVGAPGWLKRATRVATSPTWSLWMINP
jgi:hypothetical protein